MSEKDVSLPANRALVVQLRASSEASEVGHRGRVEPFGGEIIETDLDENDIKALKKGLRKAS